MDSYKCVKLENGGIISQLLACRVCLETDSKLFDMHKYRFATMFGELTGTQVLKTDGLPQHLCHVCSVLLHKAFAFRSQCRKVHILLQVARVQHPFMTTEYIKSMNRTHLKPPLSHAKALNLSIPTRTEEKLEFPPEMVLEEINNLNEDNTSIKDELFEFETSLDLNSSSDILETDEFLSISQMNIPDNSDPIKKDYNDLKKPRKNQTNTEETCDNTFTECLPTEKYDVTSKTKRKSPPKRKKENSKPKVEKIKKVREKKRKRPCNMKFIEDFADFNETYNCETVFLTKDQQLKEVEERKESESFKKSRYQCTICYKGFTNVSAHTKHMATHEKASGDQLCEICHVRFKLRRSLINHVIKLHKFRFICKTCDHVSKDSYLAKAHFKRHEGIKYECKECNKQYNALSSHLNHRRSCHASVTCDLCKVTVSGTKGLEEHNEKVHSSVKFPCDACKAKFESEEAFSRHLSSDSICIKYSPCTKCGENFANEKLLDSHRETVHGVTLFKCEECSAGFKSGRRLAAHWTLRHKLTFMCEVCARSYPSPGLLREHQRLHTGEKPHQCPMCPKRFRQKINLTVHINTHTGQRPYKCAHCDATFKSYAQRHKHILMVHKKERRHKCHMCDKTYVVSFDLKMHIRTFHMKIPLPPPNRKKSRNKQH